MEDLYRDLNTEKFRIKVASQSCGEEYYRAEVAEVKSSASTSLKRQARHHKGKLS